MIKPKLDSGPPLATLEDIQRLFGDLEASTISALMALKPTVQDIEEAAVWIAGEGGSLPEPHQPARVVAEILDLLVTDEDEEPRAPR